MPELSLSRLALYEKEREKKEEGPHCERIIGAMWALSEVGAKGGW